MKFAKLNGNRGRTFIVSSILVGLVATYEGFSDKAYVPLPGDKPTIFYGATEYADGTPVKIGDTGTEEQGRKLLKHDIDKFSKGISKCISVPVNQNEVDAYTSLSFNIGIGAFCKSTLVKKLNEYNYVGACKEILRWNIFKGKISKGLDNRRKDEYKICIGEKNAY